MADPEKPKPKKDQEKKPNKVDLEKTSLDVDIRNLQDSFEKTVMVQMPGKEDSDLHDESFFEEEEVTGEPVPEKVAKAPAPTEKKQVSPKPAPAKPVKKESKKPVVDFEKSVIIVIPRISIFYLALSIVFFLFLSEGLIEVMKQGIFLRLPAMFAVVFAGIMLGGILMKRWEGKFGFLWITVSWFALVTYAGFQFNTSDPESLNFFKLSLDSWMGPFLFLVSAIIALTLIQDRRVPFLAKLLSCMAWLLVSLAVVFSTLHGQTLEDGLWEPQLLANAPLYFRPGVLALGASFPLNLLAVLMSLALRRHFRKGVFKAAGIPLLLLTIAGTFLGAKLLDRQGVDFPMLNKLANQDFYGTTLLDPLTSSVRLQIERGNSSSDKDGSEHLEVAVSRSQSKGSTRESWLMVKNVEGRSFVADLKSYLTLNRGDKKITGAKAVLQETRLGMPRSFVILVDLPTLSETQVKTAMASAIYRVANQLVAGDELTVLSSVSSGTLRKKNKAEWKSLIDKVLESNAPSSPDLFSKGVNKLKDIKGIKEIIFVTSLNNLQPAPTRTNWVEEAKKNNIILNSLVLGPGAFSEEGIYFAPNPAAVGFELLAASANAFGSYILRFPDLAALPRISLARDNSGKVLLEGGRINFQVLASDPSVIASLQLKIDEDKPIDLDKAQNIQSIDLSKFKIKPGPHQFTISLTTVTGDVVSESFESKYTAKIPLSFVKPLDKDSVSGTFNVMFSEGKVQGVNTVSVDLFIDGAQVGRATTAPFIVSLNTSTLSEGTHNLQAVQTYSDNSNETVQIQINVNQQVPAVKIVRPSTGEYLDNLAQIEAEVGGGLFAEVQNVEFLVDGEWVGESLKAPYKFLWPNNGYPPGKYFIQARAHLNSQATNTDAVQIQLGQGELVVQADPSVSSTGMLFPDNVEVLIDSSRSMNDSIGQTVKLDLAKAALSELLQALPQQVQLSARLFGSESDSSQNNCNDTSPLKNPAEKLATIEAKGTSPLAYALEALGKDLKKTQGSRVGLLITDGWDKCGQDPIDVATNLTKQAERFRLHIIYFSDVDPATESLLKKLAEVTGGRIYKINHPEELKNAIRDAVQVSFTLSDYKNTPVIEQPLSQNPFNVRAGDYKLQVDTVPPIEKDNVTLSNGTRKTFTIMNQDGKYELKEE